MTPFLHWFPKRHRQDENSSSSLRPLLLFLKVFSPTMETSRGNVHAIPPQNLSTAPAGTECSLPLIMYSQAWSLGRLLSSCSRSHFLSGMHLFSLTPSLFPHHWIISIQAIYNKSHFLQSLPYALLPFQTEISCLPLQLNPLLPHHLLLMKDPIGSLPVRIQSLIPYCHDHSINLFVKSSGISQFSCCWTGQQHLAQLKALSSWKHFSPVGFSKLLALFSPLGYPFSPLFFINYQFIDLLHTRRPQVLSSNLCYSLCTLTPKLCYAFKIYPEAEPQDSHCHHFSLYRHLLTSVQSKWPPQKWPSCHFCLFQSVLCPVAPSASAILLKYVKSGTLVLKTQWTCISLLFIQNKI